MKCQILFSGKNKKIISICHLVDILPRVLSAQMYRHVNMIQNQLLNGIPQCLSAEYKKFLHTLRKTAYNKVSI